MTSVPIHQGLGIEHRPIVDHYNHKVPAVLLEIQVFVQYSILVEYCVDLVQAVESVTGSLRSEYRSLSGSIFHLTLLPIGTLLLSHSVVLMVPHPVLVRAIFAGPVVLGPCVELVVAVSPRGLAGLSMEVVAIEI